MCDVIVVYKLDRRGRSLKHLLAVVAQLGKMGVNQIALEIGVSKMTLYKYLHARNVEISPYQHSKLNQVE